MRIFKMMEKMELENEKPVNMIGITEAGDFTYDVSKSLPASRVTSGASKAGMAGRIGKFGKKA